MISATFSGFVLGVVVTLVVTGLFGSGSTPTTVRATLTPATPVGEALLKEKVKHVVVRQLGLGYPNGKVPRLVDLELYPAGPSYPVPDVSPERLSRYRTVYIKFRLVDHPLGRVWRLRAAKGDIFKVLHALYTNPLGVYNVDMVGIFPLKEGSGAKVENALIAIMDHSTAETVPWKRWGREDEGRLWSILSYHYLDPRFA